MFRVLKIGCALTKGSIIRRQMCWGNRNSQRPWTPRRISWFPWSTQQLSVSLSNSRRCQHCHKNQHLKFISGKLQDDFIVETELMRLEQTDCLCVPKILRSLLFKLIDFYSERISAAFPFFDLSNMNKLRLRHCLSDEHPGRREKKTKPKL